MCESLSPGKHHFEFGAQFCRIGILELGVAHRFGGLHQQLQKKRAYLAQVHVNCESSLFHQRFPRGLTGLADLQDMTQNLSDLSE